MKKNKIKKISIFLLISILVIINIPIYSKALTFDNIIEYGDDFIKEGNNGNAQPISPDSTELQQLSNFISGILLTIAIVVTILAVVIMGISFMTQSIEDKAKIKESMTPWVIGIFVAFGAYGIWSITMNIFMNL